MKSFKRAAAFSAAGLLPSCICLTGVPGMQAFAGEFDDDPWVEVIDFDDEEDDFDEDDFDDDSPYYDEEDDFDDDDPDFDFDDDGPVEEIRDEAEDYDAICTVISLGSYTGLLEEVGIYLDPFNLDDEYSFLELIPEEQVVDAAGYELYCLIPTDEDASVEVYEWVLDEENDWEGETGELLYSSDEGDPILVRCNVSDFMPNVLIIITDSTGEELTYHPQMSLEDNTLMMPAEGGVLDMTPYESGILNGYVSPFDNADMITGEDPMDFPGDWAASYVYGEDENAYEGTLTFYEEGTVEFAYGLLDEYYNNFYAGSWWYMPEAEEGSRYAGTIGIELYVYADESDSDARRRIEGQYVLLSYSDELISLTRLEGDTLFPNQYWDDVVFTATVG